MAIPKTIRLEFVTPVRQLATEDVDEVQLPGEDGFFGVLPGHAPLLTTLKVGEISYREGSAWHFVMVAWGFVEVLPDSVRVLADIAEKAEEIDLGRAKEAKARAEERLKKPDAVDWDRARASFDRALARIQVAQKA